MTKSKTLSFGASGIPIGASGKRYVPEQHGKSKVLEQMRKVVELAWLREH